MKYTTTTDEVTQFELLKPGDYFFEVISAETAISNGGKTNGCDQLELKTRFFADNTFAKPVGQWTERLTFPHDGLDKDTASFLRGKLNSFSFCTGMAKRPGDAVDYSCESVVGLRGVAKVTVRRFERKGDAPGKPTGESNQVQHWHTDKPRIARNTPPAVEADPFA